MRMITYVNYGGNCEQAFRFYEQHLGGKITAFVRHREQPNPQTFRRMGECSPKRPAGNRRNRTHGGGYPTR